MKGINDAGKAIVKQENRRASCEGPKLPLFFVWLDIFLLFSISRLSSRATHSDITAPPDPPDSTLCLCVCVCESACEMFVCPWCRQQEGIRWRPIQWFLWNPFTAYWMPKIVCVVKRCNDREVHSETTLPKKFRHCLTWRSRTLGSRTIQWMIWKLTEKERRKNKKTWERKENRNGMHFLFTSA